MWIENTPIDILTTILNIWLKFNENLQNKFSNQKKGVRPSGIETGKIKNNCWANVWYNCHGTLNCDSLNINS